MYQKAIPLEFCIGCQKFPIVNEGAQQLAAGQLAVVTAGRYNTNAQLSRIPFFTGGKLITFSIKNHKVLYQVYVSPTYIVISIDRYENIDLNLCVIIYSGGLNQLGFRVHCNYLLKCNMTKDKRYAIDDAKHACPLKTCQVVSPY